MPEWPEGRQLAGSLLVALTIVAVVIIAVTARTGPKSAAELDALQEREKQRTERIEERLEALEERREQQREGGR
jgi:cell division protein FtsB